MALKTWWGPTVLAIAVLVSACSSSGTGGTGGTGSASSPATAGSGARSASGTPVKIGLICDCSGSPNLSAQNAPGAKVLQAWAKAVNASGGIDGHAIDLTVKDDASDPGKSATAAHALISAKVDVIVDSTIFDTAWAKDVDAAKIPVVGGNLSSSVYFTDPNFFPAGETSDSSVYSAVLTAKQSGGTKLGMLYCAESPSCQELVKPVKQVATQEGVPVVYSGSISGTAPNYAAQCLAAKQAGVNALIVFDSGVIMQHVAEDCETQSYSGSYVQLGTAFTPSLASTAGLKDRLWIAFPLVPFFAKSPEITQFDSTVDKYYPGLRSDRQNWSEYALQSWAAVTLIEHAIKASGGNVSAASLTTALNSVKDDDLDGLASPVTFIAGKPHHVQCWFVGRVKGGTPQAVNAGRPRCQPTS